MFNLNYKSKSPIQKVILFTWLLTIGTGLTATLSGCGLFGGDSETKTEKPEGGGDKGGGDKGSSSTGGRKSEELSKGGDEPELKKKPTGDQPSGDLGKSGAIPNQYNTTANVEQTNNYFTNNQRYVLRNDFMLFACRHCEEGSESDLVFPIEGVGDIYFKINRHKLDNGKHHSEVMLWVEKNSKNPTELIIDGIAISPTKQKPRILVFDNVPGKRGEHRGMTFDLFLQESNGSRKSILNQFSSKGFTDLVKYLSTFY